MLLFFPKDQYGGERADIRSTNYNVYGSIKNATEQVPAGNRVVKQQYADGNEIIQLEKNHAAKTFLNSRNTTLRIDKFMLKL